MRSTACCDGAELKIRAATNRDIPRVRELVFAVLAEYGLSPDPASTDSDLDDLEGGYLRRGGLFEVVEDAAGNLVGTVGLYPREGDVCELRKMYLAPHVRGKGLGRLLLERALRQAETAGFQRVTLETAAVLKDAVRLYTRFGFRPAECRHLSARCDQAFVLDLPRREDPGGGSHDR